jgi:hypothetical protein
LKSYGKTPPTAQPYQQHDFVRVKVYKAAQLQPENAKVQLSIAKGLKYVDLYNPATPADCLRWLKKYHNEFHTGSATMSMSIARSSDEASLSGVALHWGRKGMRRVLKALLLQTRPGAVKMSTHAHTCAELRLSASFWTSCGLTSSSTVLVSEMLRCSVIQHVCLRQYSMLLNSESAMQILQESFTNGSALLDIFTGYEFSRDL